jgi:hypothetical protein
MCYSRRNPARGRRDPAAALSVLAAERADDTQSLLDLQASRAAKDNVIGTNPGVADALALVSCDRNLIEVADMPFLRDGSAGRPTVNAPLLAEPMVRWHVGEAIVEFVAARPRAEAVRAFSFGRSCEVIEGACAVLGLPVRFLTPPASECAIGLAAGRDGVKRVAECVKTAAASFRDLEALIGIRS